MTAAAQAQKTSKLPFIISLLKNVLFFQNMASLILSRLPPTVEHNIQKYQSLRKAFYLTALDQVQGDYLEFGVFTGSSFIFAMRINRRLKSLAKTTTRFFGFDSFSGFGKIDDQDQHPFYSDANFAVNEAKVRSNIARHQRGEEVRLVKGYFEDTLKGKSAGEISVRQARVVLIDCDLKQASALALDFNKPVLQEGTIILLDDFFSYRGSASRGTAGAFFEFCASHPQIECRRIFDYGYGGVGYVVSKIGASAAGEDPSAQGA